MSRRLKALRAEFGDTQQDLADYLGITVNTLNLKENGKYNFTLEEALKISQRYKKPIESIFFTNADVNMTTGAVWYSFC